MKKYLNDIFLLQRLKEDDESAFEYLFETYFAPLCRFIFLYIKDKPVAEEIALDVFTVFWEKRNEIKIKLSLKAYLFQWARNRAFNYIRDNQQHTITSTLSLADELTEDDNSLEIGELENLIEEAICSLPERCREVFRKSREESLTNKTIAFQMDISQKTVEAQITKALKVIKEYLGKKYSYLW